jgi:iron-sulfur cluster assembly protein/iron-sulfur cluster insertion protein
MIQLTEQAVAAIRKLSEEKAEAGQLMRLSIHSGGCSGLEYAMEFAHKEDSDVVMKQGDMDFMVDQKSLSHLDGSVVDFDDGLSGKGFEIRNPNAESTCGCGRSFN